MAAGALAEVVTEEVAANLEEVAQATRALDTRALGFFTGGMLTGAVIGFYFGYKYNREKLRLDAFQEAELEIDQMREHYQQKAIVVQDKPTVEQIIEERGYSVAVEEPPRPLPAPVPILDPALIETPATVVTQGKDKMAGWSYPEELEKRDAGAPYIIHQDEFAQSEHGYEQVMYMYYDGDGVLTDDDNKPLVDGKSIVGADNLKWGHGADDPDVVHIRNDRLNLEMQIVRDPRSYEDTYGINDPEDALRHSSQAHPARKRSRRVY